MTTKEKSQRIHLKTAIDAFLTDCRIRHLSHSTIAFYNGKFATFIKFCQIHKITYLDQLDPQTLRKFFLWLEERGNNSGGQHCFYRTLRAFFRWLAEEDEDFVNPLQKIKPPRVEQKVIPGISLEDFTALLNTCRGGTFADKRDKALLLLLLDTGLRIRECLTLTWDDLDLMNGSLLVKRGKSGKPRMAFFGRTTRQALRAYAKIRQDDSPFVWVARNGQPMSYETVRSMLRRRATLAGLKEAPSPHDFRRACALNLLRNGADVVTVSRLLGHSGLAVIMRYLAQTADDLRTAHAQSSPVDNLRQ